ncbi:MAG: hypothetical protein WCF25_09210 [Acidimicrobiales bacterium]
MTADNSKSRVSIGITLLVLCAGLVLSACGSNPSATKHAKMIRAACAQVAGVLSDGPDPSVDPVGYAEAQVLPLSKIKVHDAVMQTAIHYLDVEYRLFYQTNGAPAAQRAVKAALKIVDVYCPGVGS